jgi:hypothetical protein
MSKIDFSDKIYPSITGFNNNDWQKQLDEVNELKLAEVAVFLSAFDKKERNHLYKFLLKSSIKRVPLVHLRDDTDASDIKFFAENFGTEYFNIHEPFFKILNQWKGYWEKIYLELNYNDEIPKDVDVDKIGGFCIDLSHLKTAIARGTKEAYYVSQNKNSTRFRCNHLNGYDPKTKEDKHIVTDLKDFDYLITLPKYVFGEVIALEVYNSIKEQLEFKKYLVKILNEYFSINN